MIDKKLLRTLSERLNGLSLEEKECFVDSFHAVPVRKTILNRAWAGEKLPFQELVLTPRQEFSYESWGDGTICGYVFNVEGVDQLYVLPLMSSGSAWWTIYEAKISCEFLTPIVLKGSESSHPGSAVLFETLERLPSSKIDDFFKRFVTSEGVCSHSSVLLNQGTVDELELHYVGHTPSSRTGETPTLYVRLASDTNAYFSLRRSAEQSAVVPGFWFESIVVSQVRAGAFTVVQRDFNAFY